MGPHSQHPPSLVARHVLRLVFTVWLGMLGGSQGGRRDPVGRQEGGGVWEGSLLRGEERGREIEEE